MAVTISCLVVGSVLSIFFISLIRQQRHNLHLQKLNSTAEITAMEKERTRIAEDLHDEIAPSLALVKYKISDFEMDDAHARFQVEENLNEILKRIREISFDLMPAALLRKGLFSGIREWIVHLKRAYAIEIALVADDSLPLSEQKTINLFRIVQEVLHNVVKHAKATEVLIVFDRKEDLLILKIADNGLGLDYDATIKEATGFGLRSIQNRTAFMGGKLFVRSKRGQGLSYVIEIPFAAGPESQ